MKYINKKTQAVIETACEIKGGDWVKADKQPKKSKSKDEKKSGEE